MEKIKLNPLKQSEYVKDAFKCTGGCPLRTLWVECPFKYYYNRGGYPSERLCKFPKFKAFMEPDMNDLSKLTITALAGIQKAGVDGCKCGGEVNDKCKIGIPIIRKHPTRPCASDDICKEICIYTCPDCAPLRKLDLYWYEWKTSSVPHRTVRCIHCNIEESIFNVQANPDLTQAQHGSTLLLVHWLKVLGVWGLFGSWHHRQINEFVNWGKCERITVYELSDIGDEAYADILTDGKLLCQAVWSWLESREV